MAAEDTTQATYTGPMPCAPDEIRHGRGVWIIGDYEGLLVEGHGPDAVIAAEAWGRAEDRDLDGPAITMARWVLVFESCGCTNKQHARHVARDEDCACTHYGLPPCTDPAEGDGYGWVADYVDAGTLGAIAVTTADW